MHSFSIAKACSLCTLLQSKEIMIIIEMNNHHFFLLDLLKNQFCFFNKRKAAIKLAAFQNPHAAHLLKGYNWGTFVVRVISPNVFLTGNLWVL
ncbi:hypothetical protein CSX00_06095 [Pseudobutyrivibrio ruminis]|uniref:Uncharacterized protein n=2 Tax=Pseudobutyrivibrio ruminis TaxID=46206 RepID=A0A2G3EAY4_9FIRM|nr:hypothetical protein CSX00_06095 [Pseudobutyrivibrio ruminis]